MRTIQLVATSKGPLLSALSTILRGGIKVRWWTSTPREADLCVGDVVIADLIDGGPPVNVAAFVSFLSRVKVWLVTAEATISPDWLDVALLGGVQVVARFSSSSTSGIERLLAKLERELHGPPSEEIARLVCEREPRLSPASGLVRAMFEHPWEVRHPVQLAHSCGSQLSALKQTCRTLGFERIEHFMIAVRIIGLWELNDRYHLPAPVARRSVGLLDLSNASRQIKRAQVGSPQGVQSLRSLMT